MANKLGSRVHWSTRAEIKLEIITTLARTRSTHRMYRRLIVLVYDELDRWRGDGVVGVEAEHQFEDLSLAKQSLATEMEHREDLPGI